MGQIIEFQSWRRGGPARGRASGEASRWVAPATDYAEAVLAPCALWRSLLASYMNLWFAPFGIEARPIEIKEPVGTLSRANSMR